MKKGGHRIFFLLILSAVVSCTRTIQEEEINGLLKALFVEDILIGVPFTPILAEDRSLIHRKKDQKIFIYDTLDYGYFSEETIERANRDSSYFEPYSFRNIRLLHEQNMPKIGQYKIELITFPFLETNERITFQDTLIKYTATAIVFLSPFEFNKTKTEAFVYMYFTCGRLCGHTDKIFFRRKEDKSWEVSKSMLLSFS